MFKGLKCIRVVGRQSFILCYTRINSKRRKGWSLTRVLFNHRLDFLVGVGVMKGVVDFLSALIDGLETSYRIPTEDIISHFFGGVCPLLGKTSSCEHNIETLSPKFDC